MIQRVQSLLLLCVVIISVLLFYMPIYERVPIIAGADATGVDALSEPISISKSAILQILNGAIGVLSLIAILMFKLRNIQIRLCSLSILLTCVFIALLFFMVDTMSSENQRIHYLAGSYFPLIQVLLLYLSMRLIKKDDELVKSADRLR